MRIDELFTPAAIAANWTETANTRIPYLGRAWFPSRKKAGLDLSWIRGKKGLPIVLAPSAFDAKAKFRDRIGVNKIETEMPFFREGFLLKERDRQDILRAQDSGDPYAAAVLENIFDDANNLLRGAEVVPERMIWQLLAPEDGKPGIKIVWNGVNYTYDYDSDGSFVKNNYIELTQGDLWSAASTSNPLDDFTKVRELAQANGYETAYAVMRQSTLNLLKKNETVKGAILAQNVTANIYMSDGLLIEFMRATTGVNIVVYEKMFVDEEGATKFFMPENMVSFIPAGQLGSIWYGTTPEEADLMGSDAASVSIVDTGVAITTILHPHPVNIETLASEIVLPSFEAMDGVFVMKVA